MSNETDPPLFDPSLEGHWGLVSAEYAGASAPELVLRKTALEIRVGEYWVRFDGAVVDEGTVRISSVEAGTLMLFGRRGPNAGRQIPARYRARGVNLEICYGFHGEQPSGFFTEAGVPCYLALYTPKPA